jgi:hypothetical protein
MHPLGTYQNDNAEIVIGVVNNLPPAAVTFYTRWLSYLVEQKFTWQSDLRVVNA